jgi:NADPH:quinone reductase-like Zn-dependent oxidoreductase
VQCNWTDAELASIPCAYGTAENLLLRARLAAGEHVLISGASGGVGIAAVQLAKQRGALVTAITAQSKSSVLRSLGADRVVDRDADIVASLGDSTFNLVIDNVAGPVFPDLLRVLRRGGRYASSGAIAGALVALDLRTLYLKDLTLIGCTAWEPSVFPNLIKYIERGEIRPIIAKTFPLAQIADAQRDFLEKKHVGKLILIPPAPTEQSAL